MSAKKCWMASTQTDVGSFFFPPSCLSSFNFTPRCKGQEEAAGARRSCLCPAIPQALLDPKAASAVSFAAVFLPYQGPVLKPALLELGFVSRFSAGYPKCVLHLPFRAHLWGCAAHNPLAKGTAVTRAIDPPVLEPYHSTFALVFLSAGFAAGCRGISLRRFSQGRAAADECSAEWRKQMSPPSARSWVPRSWSRATPGTRGFLRPLGSLSRVLGQSAL